MQNIHRISAIALALAVAPAAWSKGPMGHKSKSEARQQYQQERAYCTSGQASEDRALCLKEAAAAYAEARGGDNTKAMGAAPSNAKKATRKVKMTKAKAKAKTEAKTAQ
jgi:hypothetical protein